MEGKGKRMANETAVAAEEQCGPLRNMWQLACVLNFFHVFRAVLGFHIKFSAEDLEAALITPNTVLADIHISLLKAVIATGRGPLRHDTWVTMLCKTLKDWWPWVAEGELPIVASHGEEIMAYNELDPGIRLLILKALCEIRVEQDDVRNYISDALKHGDKFVAFSKERLEGRAYGTSYWYEDDSSMGHRLYKEIQKVHIQTKPKGKGGLSQPVVTCQWETVATNLDEFQRVLENIDSSGSKVDKGLAYKLKNDILPLLEKIQKRQEKTLRKMQRDGMIRNEVPTRRLRERKPVNYTFDDFDRSIKEAIQITKERHSSPDTVLENDSSRHSSPSEDGKNVKD